MVGVKDSGRCWTCKDRKIRCDKQLPACGKCLSSGRTCLGYGMRLSWPKNGDRKRALVANGELCRKRKPGDDDFQLEFLNVLFRDLTIWHHLVGNDVIVSFRGFRQSLDANYIPRTLPWTPTAVGEQQNSLLSHYEVMTSKLLNVTNSAPLFALILRMAFADNSASSNAVMQALYTLAALQLYGQSKALVYKDRAIKALQLALKGPRGPKESIQSIACALLLGLCEIYDRPDASYEWARHVCHAKTSSHGIITDDAPFQVDMYVMLDWLYYHDVLSKFSIIHWDPRLPGMVNCATDRHLMHKQDGAPRKTKILGSVGCSLEVFTTLNQIFDHIVQPSFIEPDERIALVPIEELEERLDGARQELDLARSPDLINPASKHDVEQVAELYRLAGLIYLHRAIKGTSPYSAPLSRTIREGLAIIHDLDTCQRPFPLFIVGCEARTDLDRASVLRILTATEDEFHIGNIVRLRRFIERVWAQVDLDTDESVSYKDKLTASISTCDQLPAFT